MEVDILASLPLETLQQRLTEAVDAYHQITTLKKAAQISRGDRRVQYSEANVGELKAYIGTLNAAITAKKTGTSARRSPIYMGVG